MFEVRPATIGRRTLEVLLFDFDAYSRHVVIGGAQLPLANVDLSDRIDLWRALGPCSETVKGAFQLIVMKGYEYLFISGHQTRAGRPDDLPVVSSIGRAAHRGHHQGPQLARH